MGVDVVAEVAVPWLGRMGFGAFTRHDSLPVSVEAESHEFRCRGLGTTTSEPAEIRI